MSQDVYEKLQAMVGEEAGPFEAPNAVNEAMIRHWCEAMEDGNPLYSDEEYAKKSKYGGIIAPPQMVQAYCMPPLWPKKEMPDPLAKAVQMMHEAGYHGVVATTTSQEYFHPMCPGDRLSYKIQLVSVSPEKTTRLGTGHFITTTNYYYNQRDELVGTTQYVLLRYRPEE